MFKPSLLLFMVGGGAGSSSKKNDEGERNQKTTIPSVQELSLSRI